MTPDQLQALARKTADKLFDSLGLVNSASKSEAIILAALEEAVKEAREKVEVSERLGDTFFEALKLLNLPAIRVENPGSHFVDLIRERAALRTQADALATALEFYGPWASGDRARAALAAYRKEKQP